LRNNGKFFQYKPNNNNNNKFSDYCFYSVSKHYVGKIYSGNAWKLNFQCNLGNYKKLARSYPDRYEYGFIVGKRDD